MQPKPTAPLTPEDGQIVLSAPIDTAAAMLAGDTRDGHVMLKCRASFLLPACRELEFYAEAA